MLFRVQTTVLKSMGFITLRMNESSPKAANWQWRLGQLAPVSMTGVAVCFLLGSFYCCGINAANILYGFFHPDSIGSVVETGEESAILLFMQLIPFFTIVLRAFCVSLLFFCKRHGWRNLLTQADQFIDHALPSSCSITLLRRKMRSASVFLFIVTFTIHLVWEFVEWVVYMEGDNMTLSSDNFLAPLPITYYAFQGVVIWTLFSSVPFIMSQQLFTCVIMLAMLPQAAMKGLNREVGDETAYYEVQSQFATTRLTSVPRKLLLLTEERVRMWEATYMSTLIFIGRVNDFFGWILFILYGLDFLTLLGFVSNIVNNARSDWQSYAYLFLSSAIFLLYLTVFVCPLVSTQEEGVRIRFAIHRLAFKVERCVTWEEDYLGQSLRESAQRLLKRLRRFETVCQRHTLIFNGAAIIQFTRTFLVGTCTFLLSFMVLAREFFVKEKVAGVIESQHGP
ncbi:hypothetical protein BV898_02792 [Hypsibius exemplaris]|uniref:Gustatory receptor n=1 Tax=Hypsibius exemplaris TaxID=2072580 RepID=A0A1W0X744_HYPEX|nr:hypothetical protein BV898_02792 [Hypsibius exemplaris]